MPWLEWPLIYDIRAKPNQIKSETGTKDLQMVNIGLRVLYRPDPNNIAWMAKNVGNGEYQSLFYLFKMRLPDFAEKVLPSLTQETLKSVIAKYNATSLLTQRNEVIFVKFNVDSNQCIFHCRYQLLLQTIYKYEPVHSKSFLMMWPSLTRVLARVSLRYFHTT